MEYTLTGNDFQAVLREIEDERVTAGVRRCEGYEKQALEHEYTAYGLARALSMITGIRYPEIMEQAKGADIF